jgi:alpha-mannosidase
MMGLITDEESREMKSDHHPPAQVHMVGNAHIDPMWIWDWKEGMHEVLQTFRSAVNRLDEEPTLVFTASSASYYQWVEQTSPELFGRIRELVAKKRWIVTGGQWVEPDCNLPSGESVCRQFLYGQRYLAEHLGTTATVGYNIDSFGHAGTLPQLMAASGIGAYVMMRPGEHEKHIDSPAFLWEGVDGTTLPAYRIPYEYSTEGSHEAEVIRKRSAELLERSHELGYPLMAFFGVGNHGGGPTRLAVRTIRDLSITSSGSVAFSGPVAYFEALRAEMTRGDSDLPSVSGELQWHAVGCYSARASLKLGNARAEDALVVAEKMAELCRALTSRTLDVQEELAEAWRGVLFAQFHDALGGTTTDLATTAVEQLLTAAESRADRVATLAAHSIVESVDTWVAGAESAEGLETSMSGTPVPLIVFNPLSWPVTGTVSIPHPVSVATSASDERQAVQQIPSGEVTYRPTRSIMQLAVPPFGYRRFWLHTVDPEPGAPAGDGPPAAAAAEPLGGTTLTNGLLRVVVDPLSGALASLVVAGEDEEAEDWELIADGGVCPVVIEDTSDTWSHGTARYEGDERSGNLVGIAVVEDGPVRSTVRSTWSLDHSTVIQEVSLYQGRPFVELRIIVEWHESARIMKIVVPTTFSEPTSAAGAPYGFVERPCSGHEEAMVHWIDISDGWRGLACTSDAAGGYDALGARLRLTALRSPRVSDHGWGWGKDDPDAYPVTDQGLHRLRFRLTPHLGTWADAQVTRMAEEHRVNLPAVIDTWHRGRLGSEASAIEVEGDSVVVPVVKRAEMGSGTVLRVWEVSGKRSRARVTVPAASRSWVGDLGPHQVRTLFVADDPGIPVRDLDIPELELGVHAPAPSPATPARTP